jgi:hypothetical protein
MKMKYGRKLIEYMLGNFKIYTGFINFSQAEEFAREHKGELTEIVYHNGEGAPELSDKAKLVENKMPYNVELSKIILFFILTTSFLWSTIPKNINMKMKVKIH